MSEGWLSVVNDEVEEYQNKGANWKVDIEAPAVLESVTCLQKGYRRDLPPRDLSCEYSTNQGTSDRGDTKNGPHQTHVHGTFRQRGGIHHENHGAIEQPTCTETCDGSPPNESDRGRSSTT